MGLLSNIVHGVLDVAGFIPGVGAVADLANAAIYAAEGDWGNAAMSALSAIPGIGDTMALASKGAKVAKGLKGLSALGKGKALLKGMKGKLFKSLKGLAKDGASFLKKLNPKKLFKNIKKEKKHVCLFGRCFIEDTLVCTPDGYVMIRDIKEGDIVCSRDELTGETGYKKVTSISRTAAHTIYTIKVGGDTEIKATAYHPFYVEERGWINAINLSEGDRLVTEEGTSVITSICKERHEEPVTMYNFHVEDWVSYFVSELKVYVHNGGKHRKSVSKGASGAKLPPLENGPYIKNGKPNGRPGPTGDAKLDFEQKVYDAQVDVDGILREPYPPHDVIEWKPGDSRKDVVDFGHAEDLEYKDIFEQYKNKEISLEELKKFQSTPENFRIEKPGPNRSHLHEGGKK